jgi:adenosylcobyric acid synthase
MRANGLDRAVVTTPARVLGICGGCQVLGRSIDDPAGVEGGRPGRLEGLGLLPLHTVLGAEKLTRRRDVRFPAQLPPAWAALAGAHATGYEIRLGHTTGDGGEGPVWAAGRVLATTVHGLLEDPDLVERLVGRRPALVLDETFDLLADAVDAHLDTALLRRLVRDSDGGRRG